MHFLRCRLAFWPVWPGLYTEQTKISFAIPWSEHCNLIYCGDSVTRHKEMIKITATVSVYCLYFYLPFSLIFTTNPWLLRKLIWCESNCLVISAITSYNFATKVLKIIEKRNFTQSILLLQEIIYNSTWYNSDI